ncbi:MAG TPA: aminotransferase class I/II-fold pyridoxal phosphate-dependent enzyme [Lacibacter sp.]|nr:aminotransferase class I/II-fold pyridoxal phosphate-dependent enzyme [Lacibacter sp.]HMO88699.1 aminotransferase class I/II-fold pyridoxal phosphate-dependent enzyme [Lacibacter sp.]HMP87460.1 aminotransferase class I/II-fold pyridoxal phosphate-dependent enzyme [Lacibacter sp.]
MDLSFIINELGEDRDQYFNAVAPPIMQTSNFRFRRVDQLRSAFADEMSTYLYSRGLNPTVDILRKKLAALDGAEDCLVFNSGAATIFAGVLAQVKSGDHIVSVQQPYTWAQRLFDQILPRFGVETTYVDGRRTENYFEATRPTTTLYYMESPNSWDFALQDLGAIAAYARQKEIVTLIDNSYCTPLYQRPLEYGIDLAMQTATKYIGGHSDTLGGVLSGSRESIKRIFDSEYLNIGSGIQPFNAWMLLRGLRTLPARLERIVSSTHEVVQYIKQHPVVDAVYYPHDPGFPQYDLARRQMAQAPGLFSFTVKAASRQQVVTFCESLQHILMAVSWGGFESLLLPRCASLQDAEFNPADAGHRMLRMYVGLEAPAYLVADLDQAFRKAFA